MSIGSAILNSVEKAGNKLPDPVTIFLVLIGVVMLASLGLSALGTAVDHPVTGESISVINLLTGSQLQTLLVGMPGVLTGFAPLGMVLVVMIGAGIAEKTGLLSAGMRVMVSGAPRALLSALLRVRLVWSGETTSLIRWGTLSRALAPGSRATRQCCRTRGFTARRTA